jgi:pentatricopeptide repeat protein
MQQPQRPNSHPFLEPSLASLAAKERLPFCECPAAAPLWPCSSLRPSSAAHLRCGLQLHVLAAKSGLLASNAFVRNSLLTVYSRTPSALAAAHQLFDEIPPALRDAATRNTLLAALARVGHLDCAKRMLDEMAPDQRDTISYTTVVTAWARAGHAGHAVGLFRSMLAEAAQRGDAGGRVHVTGPSGGTGAHQDGAWGCCAAGSGCVRHCDH